MTDSDSRATPFVSVIMPIRNEAPFIDRSLGSVLAQDYPHDRVEVIVVDGMSTDGTRESVQNLQAQHACLRLIDNPGKIVPTGLNAAIGLAKGEVLVRVDGHCEIAPDYIRRCVAHLQENGVAGVGGRLETVGETPVAQIISVAMSSPFGVGDSAFRTPGDETVLADTIAFPAYRRAIVDRAGLFDEELVRNQDDEYNYRLRKMGAKLLLAADVHSRYYSRSSLRSLWRQFSQYGYWKVRVLQKHHRQMSLRQFVPPLFVVALAGSALLALFVPLGRVLLALVAGSYALANLVATIWTARQQRSLSVLLLPLIFAILHLAYGLGFLVGLVRFWNRWGDALSHVRPFRGSPAGGRR